MRHNLAHLAGLLLALGVKSPEPPKIKPRSGTADRTKQDAKLARRAAAAKKGVYGKKP